MKLLARLRVACIQLNAGADWQVNWEKTQKQLRVAVRSGAQIALLPENFVARAAETMVGSIARMAVPQILSQIQAFSAEHAMTIVAGSVPEFLPRSRAKKIKTGNTCYVFSSAGKRILKYRKMHLFDVDLPGVKVRESLGMVAGKKPGFFKISGIGMGVGICYDLRFPEYFRALSQKGAEVLWVPANFTAQTGKTAWEVLLRARAIENQCYVVAAGQWGRHPGSGILSYGNSMVIDPLGRVVKRAPFTGTRVLIADLDLKVLRAYRCRLPALKHRQIRCF